MYSFTEKLLINEVSEIFLFPTHLTIETYEDFVI